MVLKPQKTKKGNSKLKFTIASQYQNYFYSTTGVVTSVGVSILSINS